MRGWMELAQNWLCVGTVAVHSLVVNPQKAPTLPSPPDSGERAKRGEKPAHAILKQAVPPPMHVDMHVPCVAAVHNHRSALRWAGQGREHPKNRPDCAPTV
jgi:hypothetical protein